MCTPASHLCLLLLPSSSHNHRLQLQPCKESVIPLDTSTPSLWPPPADMQAGCTTHIKPRESTESLCRRVLFIAHHEKEEYATLCLSPEYLFIPPLGFPSRSCLDRCRALSEREFELSLGTTSTSRIVIGNYLLLCETTVIYPSMLLVCRALRPTHERTLGLMLWNL